MSDTLKLLRKAVCARAAYWTAERELEKALAPDDEADLGEYLFDSIGTLASGLEDDDDSQLITQDELDWLMKGLPT